VPPLTVGSILSGTLGLGDPVDSSGAYFDRYALTVTQGGVIQITMRSTDVDAWLTLYSGTTVLAVDDDSGGGTNGTDARITTSLVPGCYLVEASTFASGETGSYTLSALAL
jgi:hypothetical protein